MPSNPSFELLRAATDSIAKAELLEFFHKNRGAFDTADQLAVWAGRDARELGDDLAALADAGLLRREGSGPGAVYYFRPAPELEAVLPEFLESVKKGSRRTEILKLEKEAQALKSLSSRYEAELAARDKSLDEIRAKLEEQYRRVVFIQVVNNVILGSGTPSELFAGLSEKLREVAKFDAAGFLLLGDKLRIWLGGREKFPQDGWPLIVAELRRRFEGILPVSMIPEETITEILPVPLGPPGAEGPEHIVHAPLYRDKKPTGLLSLVRGPKAGPFGEEDRQLLEIVATQISIALENLYAREQVAKLAITDDLTGIYNKRQFRQTLKYECDRARIYAEALSLILIDIDHFKKVNDTFGHAYGDIVLSEMCGIVRQQIRPTDTFARYGGEEFGVILPHTDREGAVKLAERIRVSVEAALLPPPDNQGAQKITVSLGVSQFQEAFAGPDDLVADADRNLYRSKHAGRNRVSG